MSASDDSAQLPQVPLMQAQPQLVLLVEDDENDVFILNRLFKRLRIANRIHVSSDGDEAIHYLAGEGRFADRERYPLPGLLLLDLKLPRRSGFDVLEWMSTHNAWDCAIVVLTSSGEERDVVRAFELGAQSYLLKPPTTESVQDLIKALTRHPSSASRPPRLAVSNSRSPR